MHRLTERNIEGADYIPECFIRCGGEGSSSKCDTCEITEEIFERLASYEDNGITPEQMKEISGFYTEICKELAETKKKLPPCNIGDTIYLLIPGILEVFECEVIEIKNNHCGEHFRAKVEGRDWNIMFQREEIGKTIFLTAADLRKVLEEKFAESKSSSGSSHGQAPQPSQDIGDGFIQIPDGLDEELPFN